MKKGQYSSVEGFEPHSHHVIPAVRDEVPDLGHPELLDLRGLVAKVSNLHRQNSYRRLRAGVGVRKR